MAIQSRELSGKPTITIDVIQLLHSVGLDKKEIIAFTPIVNRKDVKREIGQRTIEAILKNTNEGYDRKGKQFKKYSKSYRESTIFKIYKGGKRTPNLRLSGDMQADFDVKSVSGNNVLIGFNDTEESEKAKGHILGANYLPVRDFFGLKEADLFKIMLDVITEYEQESLVILEDIENAAAPTIGTEDYQEFDFAS